MYTYLPPPHILDLQHLQLSHILLDRLKTPRSLFMCLIAREWKKRQDKSSLLIFAKVTDLHRLTVYTEKWVTVALPPPHSPLTKLAYAHIVRKIIFGCYITVDSYEWKAYVRSNSVLLCVCISGSAPSYSSTNQMHHFLQVWKISSNSGIHKSCACHPTHTYFANDLRSLLLLLYLSPSSPPARFLSFSISLFFSTHFLCLPYSPRSFFSFNPIFLFSLYLELRLSSFSHPIMLCPFFLLFLFIQFLSFPFCLSVYLSFSMSPWLVPVTVEGLYYI